MSAPWDLTCVPLMLHAQTLREGTTAHVTLVTMEMGSPVTVSIIVPAHVGKGL